VGIFDYFNGFPGDEGMVIVGVCYDLISVKSDAILVLVVCSSIMYCWFCCLVSLVVCLYRSGGVMLHLTDGHSVTGLGDLVYAEFLCWGCLFLISLRQIVIIFSDL
jgi:hypothetical protein